VSIAPPPDPDVPALEVLLGPDAPEVLNTVLSPNGSAVDEARPSQVRYLPGKSVTVQYQVTFRDADGTMTKGMMVAASGMPTPETTTTIESGDIRIAVWQFPDDPFLPGLAPASDPPRTADLLTRLGIPTDSVRIRTRAYRAGRRAVLQAGSDAGTIYIKVLRPGRIAALQRLHVDLAPHLPIPRSLGWSKKLGIVAMQSLGGSTLRHSLETGALELPSPAALNALLDQFPQPPRDAKKVVGAYERAAEHARLLRSVLPTASRQLDALVAGVSRAGGDDAPVAVHGDFHASQVLIDGGRIVGLVDVDTAGVGQRADDLANILGQLATVASVAKNRAPIDEYRALLLDDFGRRTDPTSLRKRVAGVILGLATGPFRVQLADWPDATERRLELALKWLG
jgi:hypothetical protein